MFDPLSLPAQVVEDLNVVADALRRLTHPDDLRDKIPGL